MTTPVPQVVAVAFRRWTVKHSFRPGKQEAGLMDFEGWNDVGLVRHLTLALIVLGFVTLRTERLRGEKPGVDGGAGLPGVEPSLRGAVSATAGHPGAQAREPSHPLSPAT